MAPPYTNKHPSLIVCLYDTGVTDAFAKKRVTPIM